MGTDTTKNKIRVVTKLLFLMAMMLLSISCGVCSKAVG